MPSYSTDNPDMLLQLAQSIRELHASQHQLQAMMERLVSAQERTLDVQNRLLDNQTQLLEETRYLARFAEQSRDQQTWNERQDETNLVLLEELRQLRHDLRELRQELPQHLAPRLRHLETLLPPPGPGPVAS